MKIARVKFDAFHVDFGCVELNKIYEDMRKKNYTSGEELTPETPEAAPQLHDKVYVDIEDEEEILYRPRLSEIDIDEIISRSQKQADKLLNDIKKRVMQLSRVPQIKNALIAIDEENDSLFEMNRVHLKYIAVKERLQQIKKE